MTNNLGKSLSESIASENLLDLAATVGDTIIDMSIESGVIDGIPILSNLSALYKAQKDIREKIYLNKIRNFLSTLAKTDAQKRKEFLENLNKKGKMEKFGETIILILEKSDEIEKPSIIGRIIVGHIEGHMDYTKAMRLVSIVNRSYVSDLNLLKNFQEGLQDEADIADSLFSVGLLALGGIDRGTFGDQQPGNGGIIYRLNEYGELLVAHGLS
jgi:hypothetical protein